MFIGHRMRLLCLKNSNGRDCLASYLRGMPHPSLVAPRPRIRHSHPSLALSLAPPLALMANFLALIDDFPSLVDDFSSLIDGFPALMRAVFSSPCHLSMRCSLMATL